jgi:hypothetical protein
MNIRIITLQNLPEIKQGLHPTMFWDLGFYIYISLIYDEDNIKFASQIAYYPDDYEVYVIKYDNELALDESGNHDYFEFESYDEALKVTAQIIEYFKNDLELIGIEKQ